MSTPSHNIITVAIIILCIILCVQGSGKGGVRAKVESNLGHKCFTEQRWPVSHNIHDF